MAVKIQVAVFWIVTPCSDVVGYRRFGEPCCLHHPEDEDGMVLRNVGILPHHYKVSQTTEFN
jgi:hypothetical protein